MDWTLAGGSVTGMLAEIDGDPTSGFRSLKQYITDASQKGRLLDGEYYARAPDTWGSSNPHRAADAQTTQQFVKDLELRAWQSIRLHEFVHDTWRNQLLLQQRRAVAEQDRCIHHIVRLWVSYRRKAGARMSSTTLSVK